MYVSRIPGATFYTPVTQLGVEQSPNIPPIGSTGLGGISETVASAVKPATDFISQNPGITLGVLAFLLFKG